MYSNTKITLIILVLVITLLIKLGNEQFHHLSTLQVRYCLIEHLYVNFHCHAWLPKNTLRGFCRISTCQLGSHAAATMAPGRKRCKICMAKTITDLPPVITISYRWYSYQSQSLVVYDSQFYPHYAMDVSWPLTLSFFAQVDVDRTW